MNILFVSTEMIGANLTRILKNEGHDVCLFIKDPKSKKNFDNIVEKTDNWRNKLKWVGKDGLIIFDDTGYGKVQDKLREEGYRVFGGSELGDKLETDREFGQKIFSSCGLKTVPLKDFIDIRSAINYVKKNKKAWVIKQNNHISKVMSYVGMFEDGRDVLSMLEAYEKHHVLDDHTVTLHQKINGVEIGVGRYFNGKQWVGPIEYNIEHTKMFAGDTGPITSEMGTLAWYSDNEDEKLYKEILSPIENYLKQAKFIGDFEINCIVNSSGSYPLEATSRIGTPIIHLQTALHKSPWGEFLYALASGKNYDLKWEKAYGVAILLATQPFPFSKNMESISLMDANIYFNKNFRKKDWKHVHFEEISKKDGLDQYYISDTRGYIMYATGIGSAPSIARARAHEIIEKIYIPKVFYRNDIGISFERYNLYRLKKWGYLDGIGDRM